MKQQKLKIWGIPLTCDEAFPPKGSWGKIFFEKLIQTIAWTLMLSITLITLPFKLVHSLYQDTRLLWLLITLAISKQLFPQNISRFQRETLCNITKMGKESPPYLIALWDQCFWEALQGLSIEIIFIVTPVVLAGPLHAVHMARNPWNKKEEQNTNEGKAHKQTSAPSTELLSDSKSPLLSEQPNSRNTQELDKPPYQGGQNKKHYAKNQWTNYG